FCNLLASPVEGEMTGCPGVPFQQPSNFVYGTQDAIDFFLSTPDRPYKNPGAAGTEVDAFNPVHASFDRSPDPAPFTPGRTTRLAIMGHSLGAAAVSKVQGTDPRVATVIALDKLQGGTGPGLPTVDVGPVAPTVPGLGIQSEYGFTVAPYVLSGGSSILPAPSSPGAAPDPGRERATGFDAWRAAGVDSMVVVPRSSTHLEYTDIPLVLPASRNGQALSSVYIQAWLGHYLKHESAAPLTARSFPYLEPQGNGVWRPVTVDRDANLSFYHCSAYDVQGDAGRLADPDVGRVGGCKP
ncbi:MAG: alpha/beta hydrolase, partial [Actinomycetales bacterium]